MIWADEEVDSKADSDFRELEVFDWCSDRPFVDALLKILLIGRMLPAASMGERAACFISWSNLESRFDLFGSVMPKSPGRLEACFETFRLVLIDPWEELLASGAGDGDRAKDARFLVLDIFASLFLSFGELAPGGFRGTRTIGLMGLCSKPEGFAWNEALRPRGASKGLCDSGDANMLKGVMPSLDFGLGGVVDLCGSGEESSMCSAFDSISRCSCKVTAASCEDWPELLSCGNVAC